MKHSFTPVSQRKQLDLARKPLLAAMMGILLLAGSFTVHATSVIKMKTMRQPNGEITILVRGNGPFQVEGATPATIGSGEVTLKLTSQNVSLSGDINYLNCSENDLETLDVTGCQSLTELECYENSLTKLPLDKNEKLINLTCDYNPIDTLDLSHNPHLQNLLCPQKIQESCIFQIINRVGKIVEQKGYELETSEFLFLSSFCSTSKITLFMLQR